MGGTQGSGVMEECTEKSDNLSKKAALPQLPEHFAGSSTEELPLSQQLRLGYITLRREGLHESCKFL